MPRLGVRITAPDYIGAYRAYQTIIDRRIEFAALRATDQAARKAQSVIRQDMAGARLGRLGQAIGIQSDLSTGRGVHRRGAGFSASGIVYVRSRSKRTQGMIESYTRGSEIRPVRGRWLWVPSDDLPRVSGRYDMTPERYRADGWEAKIGPLVFVRSKSGTPLLIVKDAGVALSGKRGSAKSLTKRGMPRKNQVQVGLIAFIGIPRTSRAARVNVTARLRAAQAELPGLFIRALERS
jgi:hypothetical protein